MSRLHLPSGVVALRVGPESPHDAVEGVFAAEWSRLPYAFEREGSPVSVAELALADFHTLRALARRLGELPDPSVTVECRNCDHLFEVVPSATLELGPFRDGELDDPVLDAPFDFASPHELPPLAGEERGCEVVLEPVTIARVAPLHVVLARRGGWSLTPRIVRAMGIAALDGARSPRAIARKLDDAPDDLLEALACLFEDAHYPPRLDARHACPACGMVELLPVPSEREFSVPSAPGDGLERSRSDGAFPDADAFEALVARLAPRVYQELGVRNVDLIVEDGPAHVDEGGEPLLGSYTPPDPEALPPVPPEVRIYFRSFAGMWQDGELADAADLEHEIVETLRHELLHHTSFLAGVDPVADEEEANILRSEIGRVGRRESGRRALRLLLGDLLSFLRHTWFVWVLAALATALAVWASSEAQP